MLNTSFSQNFADSVATGRNTKAGEYYNASLTPASYEKSRVLMFRNTEGIITNLGGFEFDEEMKLAAAYAILSFHFGSARSKKLLGTSLAETKRVL
jgi:hypothetical protein